VRRSEPRSYSGLRNGGSGAGAGRDLPVGTTSGCESGPGRLRQHAPDHENASTPSSAARRVGVDGGRSVVDVDSLVRPTKPSPSGAAPLPLRCGRHGYHDRNQIGAARCQERIRRDLRFRTPLGYLALGLGGFLGLFLELLIARQIIRVAGLLVSVLSRSVIALVATPVFGGRWVSGHLIRHCWCPDHVALAGAGRRARKGVGRTTVRQFKPTRPNAALRPCASSSCSDGYALRMGRTQGRRGRSPRSAGRRPQARGARRGPGPGHRTWAMATARTTLTMASRIATTRPSISPGVRCWNSV